MLALATFGIWRAMLACRYRSTGLNFRADLANENCCACMSGALKIIYVMQSKFYDHRRSQPLLFHDYRNRCSKHFNSNYFNDLNRCYVIFYSRITIVIQTISTITIVVQTISTITIVGCSNFNDHYRCANHFNDRNRWLFKPFQRSLSLFKQL